MKKGGKRHRDRGRQRESKSECMCVCGRRDTVWSMMVCHWSMSTVHCSGTKLKVTTVPLLLMLISRSGSAHPLKHTHKNTYTCTYTHKVTYPLVRCTMSYIHALQTSPRTYVRICSQTQMHPRVVFLLSTTHIHTQESIPPKRQDMTLCHCPCMLFTALCLLYLSSRQ